VFWELEKLTFKKARLKGVGNRETLMCSRSRTEEKDTERLNRDGRHNATPRREN